MNPLSRRQFVGAAGLSLAAMMCRPSYADTVATPANSPSIRFDLGADRLPTLVFRGNQEAEWFTRECAESFAGVLKKNYVATETKEFPAGFAHASPPGQAWGGTMWTRDGGTFGRELALWGMTNHACQTAECLLRLCEKNADGFYCFPEYFTGHQHASGLELDGTASIILSFVMLHDRLAKQNPFRRKLYDFLHANASPLRYIMQRLEKAPLLAGTGEFGPGCGVGGEACNSVQNSLCMIALLAGERLERSIGDVALAQDYRAAATTLRDNMLKHLVADDGSWIWCINPKTLKPDDAIINHPVNKGAALVNGVACMSCDELGIDVMQDEFFKPMVEPCVKTYHRLLNTPLRREKWDKFGAYMQFDVWCDGLLTSSSYGHGYALQTMLLMDWTADIDRAANWLARATFQPLSGYELPRESPYHFYERYYSDDALGKTALNVGCGALNLVCVSEPLKVARLMLGVDDYSSDDEVKIIPRLPASWNEIEARGWPVRVGDSISKVDISVKRTGENLSLNLKVREGQALPRLAVRLGSAKDAWKRADNVREIAWP